MVGKLDLPEKKSDSQEGWTTVRRKNGPRLATLIPEKQAHDTMNHTNRNIL